MDFFPQLLEGVKVTVALALCSSFFALILALILVWLGDSKSSFIAKSVKLYTDLIRSIPELLVIFLIYYGLAIILTYLYGEYVEVGPFLSGVIALGLVFSAYTAEVIRGAIKDVPNGQTEAGLAIGLGKFKTFTLIILPQVMRRALPGLGNLWLIIVKETSLVSVIGLEELMRKSSIAAGVNHDPLLFYSLGAVLYIGITTISSAGLMLLEKRASHYKNMAGAR